MPRRIRQDKLMRTLFWTLGVLIVALIVALILMLATGGQQDTEEQRQKQIETGKYIQGVSIGGVDVSGMTYEQASTNAEILAKAKAVEDGFTYVFTVNGKEVEYSAAQLGITSNLTKILEDAIIYGNIGNGAEIREQRTQASENGTDFELKPFGDYDTVKSKITELKTELDVLPKDATLEISDDLMGEARFNYIDEVEGVDIDAALFASQICDNINNEDYSVIAAPAVITNPKIDAATIRANTKLIATYTSSFEGRTLSNEDRVTNIKLLAGIVNGVIIQPGEIWSINDDAGPRNATTAKTVGWREAPGIASGRYTAQYGGGVCQVSSSVYNAAVRAELEIVERRAHSWPSSYIADGMDATISTGGPDLKLMNPYDMPVYIAAFVDEEEKTVTVEVYGTPLAHGYEVDFVNKRVRTIPAGDAVYHYNATVDPDGVPIAEGKTVTWIRQRDGEVWKVYKVYKKDGEEIKREFFSENTYRKFTGVYYVNGNDPDIYQPSEPAE